MEIINIVATVEVSSSFDLQEIANAINDTEFSSSGGTWLKMRLQPENKYVAFYKSGKFLITGAKSVGEIESIKTRVISILTDFNIHVDRSKIILHNFVIMDSIKLNKPLETVIYALDPEKASYEPEQFPGLVYKDWNATFLLFSSGKIIITGIKDVKLAETVIKNFKDAIKEVL